MTFKVKVNASHFQYQLQDAKMHIWCKFGDSSSKSESKWPKWPWRSRSTTSIFNISWEYPMMHVWCKFGDSNSNLWRVIARTNESLQTDGTDGRTDAGNDNTPSAWKALGLKKMGWSYCADKPKFLEVWVKMAKMTLKVKDNDLHFQYQLRVSHDACLVQIWWFQLKSVTSYRAEKWKFTVGRDRWTDRRR